MPPTLRREGGTGLGGNRLRVIGEDVQTARGIGEGPKIRSAGPQPGPVPIRSHLGTRTWKSLSPSRSRIHICTTYASEEGGTCLSRHRTRQLEAARSSNSDHIWSDMRPRDSRLRLLILTTPSTNHDAKRKRRSNPHHTNILS